MLYLILLLPLALAALSLIRNDRARTVILAVGQALLLAVLIAACTLGDTATPVWHMTADLTFSLRLDGLGRFFCLLTAVCWLLTIPYAAVYMTHEGHHPRFYVFLMLTEAAVLGAALAADLVTLYLFYELTTLLSFPLVLHTQRPKALLGVFLMTPVGLLGGLLQLLFHALAKIGVFQSAGSIIFLTGTETIDGFPGLGRRIPVTMGCFAALSLSLVGIPPFGGFFSKWYLALGALDGMSAPLCYIIPAVLLISALLTAAYLFPPLCRAFFPGQDFPAQSRVREPLLLVLSLALFAAASLILGLLSGITVPVMEHITGSIL